MKALVSSPSEGLQLLSIPEPVPNDGDVLVAPLLVGLCGTDLELIDATIDPMYVRYPLVLGHEWVGQLVADADGLGMAGERVVVEGIIPCGVCDACRVGDTNRCATYDEIGFTHQGALAERIAVPARLVHVLNERVTLDDAVLVEPMAVVWRALTRLPVRQGSRVAIIGDGTIGLLAAHLVRLFAPTKVVMVGRRIAQADLARRAGADHFVTETPEERFDLVIEAAGVAEATSSALVLADRGATVTLLGLPAHGTKLSVRPDDLVNNDLIIQGSFSYTRDAWREVVSRLNEGLLRPSFLITHRFSIDEFDGAVAALRGTGNQVGPRGKVIVDLR